MRLDDACFGSRGSVTVAASVMTSMPKPGSMVSILSQSSRYALDVAQRQAGPDPHGLCSAINALTDQIEPPCAEAPCSRVSQNCKARWSI